MSDSPLARRQEGGGSIGLFHAPHDLDSALRLGKVLLEGGMVPSGLRNPAAVCAVMIKGAELGIPPMAALESIHIIKGKPTLSADLMIGLVRRSGLAEYFDCVETSDERATWTTKRKGSQREQTLTFTMEQAKVAKLTGRDNWKAFPAAMLRARAGAHLARMAYQDVVGGLYTPDELGAIERPDGTVEVIDVDPDPVQSAPANDDTPRQVRPKRDADTDPGRVKAQAEAKAAMLAEVYELEIDEATAMLREAVIEVAKQRARLAPSTPRAWTVDDVTNALDLVIGRLDRADDPDEAERKRQSWARQEGTAERLRAGTMTRAEALDRLHALGVDEADAQIQLDARVGRLWTDPETGQTRDPATLRDDEWPQVVALIEGELEKQRQTDEAA